jgi:hypothetical protein
MSEDIKRKDRPGDQPLPVPNDGPSMHDLVCADLQAMCMSGWPTGIAGDLQARKRLGLERYGSLLQAHNGRDALRDLYEELLDATVYACQAKEEEHGPPGIVPVYESLLTLLIQVRRLRDEY